MTPSVIYKQGEERFNAATNTRTHELIETHPGPYAGRPLVPSQMKFLLRKLEEVQGQCANEGTEFTWDKFNAATGTPDNALGFQITIDTLTSIWRRVVGQKLYTVPFADFIPVTVGNSPWAKSILTPLSFMDSGDPEEGFNSTGGTGGLASTSEASMASILTVIKTWFDSYFYSLAEINEALVAANWDIIAARAATQKAKADQLLQRVAFLGAYTDQGNVTGLLNAPNVNILTTLPGGFTGGYINSMNAAQISTFVQAIMADYFANSNRTELPDTFVIPMSDYLGLTVPFPGAANPVPMIDYLLLAFQKICGPKFRILPVAYADINDPVNVQFGLSKRCYALYRKDEMSLRMEIPVPFQVQSPGTADGLKFVATAAMQLTGVIVSRPLELRLYQLAS